MAKERDEQPASQSSKSVFDVAKIRELIELMQEHELNEVDLRESDQRIRLRRGAGNAPTAQYAAAPATPAAPAASAPASAAAPIENGTFITCPTIGTFYSRPKPDSNDFVKVGDMVTPDTIVCLVEAMKMFNEIPAGISGKIVEIMVKNEEAVDNNKPLFRVIPS
jgi:acetyl-CoA carboxylase biotin carboxyl carrier protein